MRSLVIALVALASGCAFSESSLRAQASVDLKCEQSKLTVAEVGEARAVSGCGHSATYVAGRDGWAASELDGTPQSVPDSKASLAPNGFNPAPPSNPTAASPRSGP